MTSDDSQKDHIRVGCCCTRGRNDSPSMPNPKPAGSHSTERDAVGATAVSGTAAVVGFG